MAATEACVQITDAHLNALKGPPFYNDYGQKILGGMHKLIAEIVSLTLGKRDCQDSDWYAYFLENHLNDPAKFKQRIAEFPVETELVEEHKEVE